MASKIYVIQRYEFRILFYNPIILKIDLPWDDSYPVEDSREAPRPYRPNVSEMFRRFKNM